MQSLKHRLLALAAAFAFSATAAACGQGPAEQAGEAADSAYENTTQGYANPGDGPLENAGEKIDDANADPAAVADEAKQGADAAVDATTPAQTPPAQ